MAQNKPALKDISKTELADAYSKLKARTEKASRVAREEGERLTHDVITLGSAFGSAYGIGALAADAASDEEAKEATQVMGVDYDLLGGGVLLGAGLFKVAGKSSDMLRCAGVGVLSQYLGRMAYQMGREGMGEE
jgi:hypothetical protein